MKVEYVFHSVGKEVPDKFKGPGPYEITFADLAVLILAYDVAFMHARQPELTKRQKQAGAIPPPDRIHLVLDDKGKHFAQR